MTILYVFEINKSRNRNMRAMVKTLIISLNECINKPKIRIRIHFILHVSVCYISCAYP